MGSISQGWQKEPSNLTTRNQFSVLRRYPVQWQLWAWPICWTRSRFNNCNCPTFLKRSLRSFGFVHIICFSSASQDQIKALNHQTTCEKWLRERATTRVQTLFMSFTRFLSVMVLMFEANMPRCVKLNSSYWIHNLSW